ncbi:hypothetical protein GDO78_008922 [Eleutherodactylus coqui]|uniref:Uncharacterized protein n=1 Tax=Eleutherodactylus coqui TaxID=57060 RepID=A0A8J6FEL7_ELECQ|nr:hypothetical protein GDO78_008922 [Eleutherodactylus coqui]
MPGNLGCTLSISEATRMDSWYWLIQRLYSLLASDAWVTYTVKKNHGHRDFGVLSSEAPQTLQDYIHSVSKPCLAIGSVTKQLDTVVHRMQ